MSTSLCPFSTDAIRLTVITPVDSLSIFREFVKRSKDGFPIVAHAFLEPLHVVLVEFIRAQHLLIILHHQFDGFFIVVCDDRINRCYREPFDEMFDAVVFVNHLHLFGSDHYECVLHTINLLSIRIFTKIIYNLIFYIFQNL